MPSRSGSMVRWMAAACCGLLLVASPALAKRGHSKDAGKHAEMLAKKLKLTQEQRPQVEQILNDYQARVQPLLDQLEALRTEKHGKIRAVLTPEQQEKFDRWHEKKMKRHHAWWRRGRKRSE